MSLHIEKYTTTTTKKKGKYQQTQVMRIVRPLYFHFWRTKENTKITQKITNYLPRKMKLKKKNRTEKKEEEEEEQKKK